MVPNQAAAPAPRLEPGDGLFGIRAITRFTNQVLGTDLSEQVVYGWVARKKIPVGRNGAHLIGSKRAIAESLARDAGLVTPDQNA